MKCLYFGQVAAMGQSSQTSAGAAGVNVALTALSALLPFIAIKSGPYIQGLRDGRGETETSFLELAWLVAALLAALVAVYVLRRNRGRAQPLIEPVRAMRTEPDAKFRMRLNLISEGGRASGIGPMVFHCMLHVGGAVHDCRLYPEGRKLELGLEYDVPVRFLAPPIVIPKLTVGKEIGFWEGGKEFAKGTVVWLRHL
jgi:hypothetical protein